VEYNTMLYADKIEPHTIPPITNPFKTYKKKYNYIKNVKLVFTDFILGSAILDGSLSLSRTDMM